MASARLANAANAKKAATKVKETVQAVPANISRKRKGPADDDKSTVPQAKKARAAVQKTPPSKTAKTQSRKRKTSEDDEESPSPTPPAKKARVTPKATAVKAKKAPAPKKSSPPKKAAPRKKAAPKAPAAKKTSLPKKAVSKPPAPKVQAAKAKAAKVVAKKPKVVINQVPTQRLDVYVFGEGSSSELGLGTAKTAIDVKRPRLNPLLSSKDVGVVHVACGGMHAAALTHDNKILTWGVNDQGALGRDTTWGGGLKDIDDNNSDVSDESDSGLNPLESNPTPVDASSFPDGTTFVQLSAGDNHTLALTDEGQVYGWGCFRVSTFAESHHVLDGS